MLSLKIHCVTCVTPTLIEIIDYRVLLIYTKIYVYMSSHRFFVSQPVLNKT